MAEKDKQERPPRGEAFAGNQVVAMMILLAFTVAGSCGIWWFFIR